MGQLGKSSLGRGMGKGGHYAHQITKLFVLLMGKREMIGFFSISPSISDGSSGHACAHAHTRTYTHTQAAFPGDETNAILML